MPYLNKIMIMGHVGKNAETSTTDKGTEITKFSVATTYKSKDYEETTWHNIIGFNLPDFLKNLQKGDLVFIEGRQTHKSYEKNGDKKYYSQVIAERIMKMNREPKETQNEIKDAMNNNDDLPF